LQEYEKKINHQLSKGEDEELENEHLKPDLNAKMKEELKKHKEEQLILKENKQTIVEFLLDNKDLIRVEDLKIYEPIYKCYRERGYQIVIHYQYYLQNCSSNYKNRNLVM
jgi:hypothetical protein